MEERQKIRDFLETMPKDLRRYHVKPEQRPFIEEWMLDRDFNGGVSFTHDFSMIYKCDISDLKEREKK